MRPRQGYDPLKVWTGERVKRLLVWRGTKTVSEGLSEKRLETCRLLDGYETVLDVGCGWMAGADERYVGVDVSPAMLSKAAAVHPGNGLVMANSYSLPFSDRGFEGVLSTGMLRHLEEWRPALREMLRVCSKRLVFTQLVQFDRGKPRPKVKYWQWSTDPGEVEAELPVKPEVSVINTWPGTGFRAVRFIVDMDVEVGG